MCPTCRHTIRFLDNVPLLGFFLLKQKCRHCGHHISWQYPLVEFALATLFVLTTFVHLQGEVMLAALVRDMIFVFLLAFVFVYDLLYKEIWDHVTTIPALMYAPLALFLGWQSWQSLLVGAGIGAGFFYLQYALSKGKWVGGGDVRMGFFMGVILGFPGILLALLMSYVIGAAGSVMLLASGKKNMKDATPFGTYLAIGAMITLFWGEYIITWYLGLL